MPDLELRSGDLSPDRGPAGQASTRPPKGLFGRPGRPRRHLRPPCRSANLLSQTTVSVSLVTVAVSRVLPANSQGFAAYFGVGPAWEWERRRLLFQKSWHSLGKYLWSGSAKAKTGS